VIGLLAASHVWAGDTTVCASGPPECGFATIQAAVDAAQTGDVVHLVETGSWTESVVVERGVVLTVDAVPAPLWQPVSSAPALTVRGDGEVTLVGADLGGGETDLVVVEAGASLSAIGGTWTGANRTGATVRADPGAWVLLSDVVLQGALGSGDGGAVYATDATVLLQDVLIAGNGAARGAGLFVQGGTLTARRLALCDNTAVDGAGLFAEGATLDLRNVVAVRNEAEGTGGAAALIGSGGQLDHWTAVGNAASEGAVLHVDASPVLLSQSAVVQSQGVAVSVGAGATPPTDIVLFWSNQDGDASAPIAPTDLIADPQFVSLTHGPDCGLDLRPTWESPLVDAGHGAPSDLDGSPQDLGSTGGPYADADDWVDDDGDGVVLLFDCAPDDPMIAPTLPERCNGVDDDCDGALAVDEIDADADGAVSCAVWEGAPGVEAGDCDDLDGTRHPGAVETCDGDDDDCDGVIDDEAIDASVWFVDADADGFGGASDALASCDPVAGRVERGGDCDDADASAFPGAPEWCDDVDSDCDGLIGDPEAVDAIAGWMDADGDEYGSPTDPVRACPGTLGIADNPLDCNDTDRAIHPGAQETFYDGVDGDCAGGSDFDADRDGTDSNEWGGTDCDDHDPSVHPGAVDLPADGVDQDCDGVDLRFPGAVACAVVGGPSAASLPWAILLVLRRRRRAV
jgi:hypothetical protein